MNVGDGEVDETRSLTRGGRSTRRRVTWEKDGGRASEARRRGGHDFQFLPINFVHQKESVGPFDAVKIETGDHTDV